MRAQGRGSLVRSPLVRRRRRPEMGEMGEQFQGGQPPILDLLNLEYIEQNLYRSSVVFDGQRPRLYGGQVAAQALYAAGQTVPAGRLPHSLHGYFLRQGSTLRPTVFQVERDRDGYSVSARPVGGHSH